MNVWADSNYIWLPITQTFRGNWERFELLEVQVVRGEISNKMTWRENEFTYVVKGLSYWEFQAKRVQDLWLATPHSHFMRVLSLKSFSKGLEVHSIIWGVMAIVQRNMICIDLQTELQTTSHKYLAVRAGKGYWTRIIVHRQFNCQYM